MELNSHLITHDNCLLVGLISSLIMNNNGIIISMPGLSQVDNQFTFIQYDSAQVQGEQKIIYKIFVRRYYVLGESWERI